MLTNTESKRDAFIDICASNLKKLLNLWCQLAEPLKGGFGKNVEKLNQLLCEQKKLIEQEKKKLTELELEKKKLIDQEKEKSKAKSFLGKMKGKFGVKEETLDEKIERKKQEINKKIGRKKQEVNEKLERKKQEINEINRKFEASGMMPLRFSLSPVWVNFLLDDYAVRECNVAIRRFRVDWDGELRLHIVADAHLNIAMPFPDLNCEDTLSVDVNIPVIDLSFYGANAGRVISNIELGSTLKTLPDIIWDVIKKKVRIRPKKTKPEDREYKTHVAVPKVRLSLGLDNSCKKINLVIDNFDLDTCISKKQEAYEVKLPKVLFELPSHTVNFVNDLCDQLGGKLTNSKIFIDENQFEGHYMLRRPAALMNIIPATLRKISHLSQYCSMDTFSLSSSGTYFCVNRTIKSKSKSKSESKSKGYDVKVNHPMLQLYATHKTEEGVAIEAAIHELSYSIKRLDEIDVVDFTFVPRTGGEAEIWPFVRKTLKEASFKKLEFLFNGFLFTNGLLLATDVWEDIFNNTTDLYDLMYRFKPEERDAVINQAFSTIDFMRLVRDRLACSGNDEPRHMCMTLGAFNYESVIGFFDEKRESKKDPRHRFLWAQSHLEKLYVQRDDSSLLQSLSCEAIIGEWLTRRETVKHWFSHFQPYFGDVKNCQIVLQGDERVFIYHLQMNDQGIEKCVFNTPEGVEKIVDESDEDAAENFVLSTLRAARPDIFSGLSAWVETTYI
ncbi:hypothetical protein GCM10023116_10550 [Kistimonas scapharcae]|uniref:Uncharacterized protein n=1 Tax=Kistimonas scapharcae TaxID=1036133 RepID=A0ABP8V1N6_9GAMM